MSTSKNHLEDKHYNPSVFAVGRLIGYMDGDKRVVIKKDFRKAVKEQLKVNNRQLKIFMDTLIELGLVEEDKDRYYWNPLTTDFIKLKPSTIRYCVKVLSPITFKVYCYLMSKKCIHDKYEMKENYFFSCTDLLKVCGYEKTGRNVEMMNQILFSLKRLKLIDFNEEYVSRPGARNMYRELLDVMEQSDVQKKAYVAKKEEQWLVKSDLD